MKHVKNFENIENTGVDDTTILDYANDASDSLYKIEDKLRDVRGYIEYFIDYFENSEEINTHLLHQFKLDSDDLISYFDDYKFAVEELQSKIDEL